MLSGSDLDRGNAYHQAGNFLFAIDSYTAAIRINPNSAEAYQKRGNAYRALANTVLAIQDYDRAIRLEGRASAYLDRATANFLQSRESQYDTRPLQQLLQNGWANWDKLYNEFPHFIQYLSNKLNNAITITPDETELLKTALTFYFSLVLQTADSSRQVELLIDFLKTTSLVNSPFFQGLYQEMDVTSTGHFVNNLRLFISDSQRQLESIVWTSNDKDAHAQLNTFLASCHSNRELKLIHITCCGLLDPFFRQSYQYTREEWQLLRRSIPANIVINLDRPVEYTLDELKQDVAIGAAPSVITTSLDEFDWEEKEMRLEKNHAIQKLYAKVETDDVQAVYHKAAQFIAAHAISSVEYFATIKRDDDGENSFPKYNCNSVEIKSPKLSLDISGDCIKDIIDITVEELEKISITSLSIASDPWESDDGDNDSEEVQVLKLINGIETCSQLTEATFDIEPGIWTNSPLVYSALINAFSQLENLNRLNLDFKGFSKIGVPLLEWLATNPANLKNLSAPLLDFYYKDLLTDSYQQDSQQFGLFIHFLNQNTSLQSLEISIAKFPINANDFANYKEALTEAFRKNTSLKCLKLIVNSKRFSLDLPIIRNFLACRQANTSIITCEIKKPQGNVGVGDNFSERNEKLAACNLAVDEALVVFESKSSSPSLRKIKRDNILSQIKMISAIIKQEIQQLAPSVQTNEELPSTTPQAANLTEIVLRDLIESLTEKTVTIWDKSILSCASAKERITCELSTPSDMVDYQLRRLSGLLLCSDSKEAYAKGLLELANNGSCSIQGNEKIFDSVLLDVCSAKEDDYITVDNASVKLTHEKRSHLIATGLKNYLTNAQLVKIIESLDIKPSEPNPASFFAATSTSTSTSGEKHYLSLDDEELDAKKPKLTP